MKKNYVIHDTRIVKNSLGRRLTHSWERISSCSFVPARSSQLLMMPRDPSRSNT